MKRWIRVFLFVIAFGFFVGTLANLAHYHFFGHGLWQPAISCERNTQQIGTIAKATAAPCRFRVDNIGRRRLTIHKVLSGCGSCIEVKTFPKEIAPGGSGVICVELQSHRLQGRVEKKLTVHSNDPKHPVMILSLQANIQKPQEESQQSGE